MQWWSANDPRHGGGRLPQLEHSAVSNRGRVRISQAGGVRQPSTHRGALPRLQRAMARREKKLQGFAGTGCMLIPDGTLVQSLARAQNGERSGAEALL